MSADVKEGVSFQGKYGHSSDGLPHGPAAAPQTGFLMSANSSQQKNCGTNLARAVQSGSMTSERLARIFDITGRMDSCSAFIELMADASMGMGDELQWIRMQSSINSNSAPSIKWYVAAEHHVPKPLNEEINSPLS